MSVWDVHHLATGEMEPPADPNKVTVFNMRFCPFAQRTILTLLAKNMSFDVVNIDLKKKPTWFVEKTYGTVSVVKYKGEYIMESLVNSDFVDELDPVTSLHPRDPVQKALGRLLVEKIGKMIKPYYGVMRVKGDTIEETKQMRKVTFEELKKTLEFMDQELQKKDTKFFFGDSVGMTDLMVWPWIERLPVHNIAFPGEGFGVPSELKALNAWIANMKEVPAVKSYMLEPMIHAKFYQQYASDNCNFDFLLTQGT